MNLHGKISSKERYKIANEFNTNKKIKLLLLTVSVGGLGLNLSTTDTVIFMEHDWNPIMNDLQEKKN